MSDRLRAHWEAEARAVNAEEWWIAEASTDELRRNVNDIRLARDGLKHPGYRYGRRAG